MAALVGSVGERCDIPIRAGNTLGPYEVQETDVDTGDPIDFTGATITGWVKRAGAAGDAIALTIDVTDAAGGKYTISLDMSVTAGLVGGSFFAPRATYGYKVDVTWPDNTKETRLYGQLRVVDALPS